MTIGLRFYTDPIALFEEAYIFCHLHDLSCHFMPEYHRGFSKRVSPSIGVEIGATNPYALNLYEHIVGTQSGLFYLLKTNLIGGC
jgi:hypothetical protein